MEDKAKIRQFVIDNFKKNFCIRYVSKDVKNLICYCGVSKEDHSVEAIKAGIENQALWTKQECIGESTTDAFGEITFLNGNKAKYIRVSKDTSARKLLEMMNIYWKLKDPKLLISITGGAIDFALDHRLKQVFQDRLIKASSSTNAWIVTGGMHAGVMKHVGEAVRNYTLKYGNKKPIVNIGIATWGCIANYKSLINNEGCFPATYESNDKNMKGESALDMNHSHFILVDDGTRLNFGVEIELRALLEKEISEKKTSEDSNVSIPRIVVVLEGGPNTLETVISSMNSGAPVIVIEGSGRVANLLAFAYNNSEPLEIKAEDSSGFHSKMISFYDESFHEKLEMEIIKTFPKIDFKITKNKILNCIAKRDFLTNFKLDNNSDIDIVILQALIKTKKILKIDQLRLAFDWNQADTASTEILMDYDQFKVEDIEELMFKALIENKIEFVQLFISHDFSLQRFLYKKKNLGDISRGSRIEHNNYLLKLYKHPLTKKKNPEMKLPSNGLKEIGEYITYLTGDYYKHRYLMSSKSGQNEAFKDPANDLFLWCVFVSYKEMAMVFWEQSKHNTASAITAQHLTKSLFNKYPDSEISETLEADSIYYGEVAVALLDECYKSDQKRTMELLMLKQPAYDGTDVLKMAVKANNMEFVAHPAVQNKLTNIWMGNVMDNNYFITIIVSLIFPFLAPIIIQFNEGNDQNDSLSPDIENTVEIRDENRKNRVNHSYFGNLIRFLSCPFTKFCYYCASHFALILLFGIILLTDFYPINFYILPIISIKEIILIIWMFALFLEEIRQAFTDEAKTITSRLYNYSNDIWNILDMIILLLYFCGLILRFIPIYLNENCFYASRIVLSFCFLLLFLRILNMFSIHRNLGPKIVMIGKMMIDLFYFMLILMVFISAYGISTHIIMYPNQPLNIVLARDVLSSAWWDIFGELNIDEVSGKNCQQNDSKLDASFCAATFYKTDDWSQCLGKEDSCPAINWLVPFMLAIYALVIIIMMLNILIAIFSNTFENIQNQTNLVWKLQRYSLVREFEKKPTLPPPLNLIGLLYQLIKYLKNVCNAKNKIRVKNESIANNSIILSTWESINSKEYRIKQLSTMNNIADTIITNLDFENESKFEKILNRLDFLEMKTSNALEWLVERLGTNSDENYKYISAKEQMEIDEKRLLKRKNDLILQETKKFQKELYNHNHNIQNI